MTVLAALCFAVSAARLLGVVLTLRDLVVRQRATLAGVTA